MDQRKPVPISGAAASGALGNANMPANWCKPRLATPPLAEPLGRDLAGELVVNGVIGGIVRRLQP